MKGIYIDPDSKLVTEVFAVVYAPRGRRGRFAEECVTVVESASAALEQADAQKNLYAAKVVGPARSSEGFRIFYLASWLDETAHP